MTPMTKAENIIRIAKLVADSPYGYLEVSTDTLHIFHLISNGMEWLDTETSNRLRTEHPETFARLDAYSEDFGVEPADDDVYFWYEVLASELDDLTPEGFYFGDNEGCSSDIGWWPACDCYSWPCECFDTDDEQPEEAVEWFTSLENDFLFDDSQEMEY